jgi:ATP-dependent DNA helicase RecQ
MAPDPNIQAQLAMAELLRLRALDPTADWADIAVLSRTHASLEPIRAYCEWKGIAYRTGEQGQGGLSAVKTREGHRVIAALRRRPSRMVRSRALRRWLTALVAAEPENPWLADLRDCAIELESAVGGVQVPRADAIDWLYESAGAHARQAPGHLNLLTAHGAKGREFAHVLVLDAGDWPTNQPDERRLLYVAMTRARETLTLSQATQCGNPMLAGLDELAAVRPVEPKVVPLPLPELNRQHRALTLGDVDLGFAGRQPARAAMHQAIVALKHGDQLRLKDGTLLDANGHVVGKLAKKCQLPAGKVVSVRVLAIVRRTRAQSPASFQDGLKVDDWEVVVPEVVISP